MKLIAKKSNVSVLCTSKMTRSKAVLLLGGTRAARRNISFQLAASALGVGIGEDLWGSLYISLAVLDCTLCEIRCC